MLKSSETVWFMFVNHIMKLLLNMQEGPITLLKMYKNII